ncbi:hypothetical protein [Nitrosomonas ureae]|uniref:Uncharacterized protein n=1 Tax=Nitrosomonas ureae TaxID=44577 RepID=A0A1H5XAK0_9PROT|nr:hypothetical protein [Nitrosomonas ureae]SEG08673.1 hypothetical protein SAMN05216334_12535 [Nitrosomonas ureae]
MAKPIGTYSFLPYLRTGLANKIQQLDQDPVKLRASFQLKLNVEGTPVAGGAVLTQEIDRAVQLYGPGDIVGIDSRTTFKTEPLNWITNFEPNYLPYIDFYDEDFAWRYTPNRPDDAKHRLRPWLALVVLEESEFSDGTNIKDRPLPFIQVVNAAASFPPPEQLWAWAHVHVNQDLAASDAEILSTDMNVVLPKLNNVLHENQDHAYCRIVCPRKLKANAAYHAFLIPSYESGRQAGLGLEANPDFASQYAWGQKADQGEFPYYHRWYFRTGTVGDFEYLVRLLKAKPADEHIGRRDIDVQQPGWNIPGIDPDGELAGILKLGGALRVPLEVIKDPVEFNKYENWAKDGYPQPIQKGIARFLNAADDYQKPGVNPEIIPDPGNAVDPDPLITPPLYGRWHAAVDRLLTNAAGNDLPNNRNWIHELNLDPRFRVPAGFGTKIIQNKQEDYMNAAWQQVGDVLKANRFIRFAQLSSETSWQWHTLQFQPLLSKQPDKLMLLSAPVQKRIMVQNATAFHQIKTSVVPPVAVSAQMRKVLRPRSRLISKLPFAARGIEPSALFGRLNRQEVMPAPPKVIPAGIGTEQVLAEQVQPVPRPKWLADLLGRYPWLATVTLVLAVSLALLAILFAPAIGLSLLIFALAGGLFYLYRTMRDILRQLAEPQIFTDQGQTPAAVDVAPKSPDFQLAEPGDTFHPRAGNVDSQTAINFKAALKDMYTADLAARQAAFEAPKQVLDMSMLTATLVANLHPYRTIPRLVLDRILLPERFRIKFVPELFDEVMNYPEFDIPMYKPLADLSTEYFLPNINLIEQNSITLLEPNSKFIEAYMVGLNHEMSRELLWREYPTDQRGSYFRQFWDVSAYLPQTGENLSALKEKLKDIPELHHWPLTSETSALGKQMRAKGEDVVLVIRGELLKKYPTAVIYAHKAKWQTKKPDGSGGIDNTKERLLVDIPAGQEDNPPRDILKTPLYSAKVEPDIYFFGFDLKSEEAKGSDGTQPGDETKPGWYFVIKERPGEPRFGLDIGGPTKDTERHTWSDLTWEDAAPGLADGDFLSITNATATIRLTEPTDTLQAEFVGELEQYKEDNVIAWSKDADAADLAYILYQVPVMVAVHASEMLK